MSNYYETRYTPDPDRTKVWRAIVDYISAKYLNSPQSALDLGCGYGDFINNLNCPNKVAIDLNPDLAYAIPIEGSNVWVDCMVIPKTAKNKENAEAFINFLCRPDIAQKNCEAIWYSTPNTEAIKLMGEEYTSNTTMNPSAEDVANCEYFHDIQDFIAIYNALWQEVKNAK